MVDDLLNNEVSYAHAFGGSAVQTGHWEHVVSHLDPRYGGLSAIVPQLASEIVDAGQFTVGLAAFCAPGEEYSPVGYSHLSLTNWPTSRLTWLRDRGLRKRFDQELRKVDGIHIHGLWEQSTAVTCHAARALGKPYVLSAHGMLEPWALRNKRVKKYLYSALLERANVNGAACLHALTHAEALNYREYGSRAPIAVIPNGVRVPEGFSSELFLHRFPELTGKRIILYLGRIHFKKGVNLLVEAWKRLSKQWQEAHLVIAGPDFEGTRAATEKQVEESGLTERVTFTGMLGHELKWSALAASECFVLPSHSEGLSVSTLEAMGAGLPVIVTRQSHMPEVEQVKAGWQIEPDAGELTSALNEFLCNTAAANAEIGNRGRRLVEDRYSWPVVAGQMSELYGWVQGGPVPRSVELLVA